LKLRSSLLVLFALGLGLAMLGLLWLDAGHPTDAARQQRSERHKLAERLGLTDLSLFMEARYTRHPSQADLHAALQDHPAAFEHFPSGALLPPPAVLTESHAYLAGKTTSPD
jgi:hypothetical protein